MGKGSSKLFFWNVLFSHLSVKKQFVKITLYLRTRFRRKEQRLNLELQNQLLRVLVEPELILHVQLDPYGVPLRARYLLVLPLLTILHGWHASSRISLSPLFCIFNLFYTEYFWFISSEPGKTVQVFNIVKSSIFAEQ